MPSDYASYQEQAASASRRRVFYLALMVSAATGLLAFLFYDDIMNALLPDVQGGYFLDNLTEDKFDRLLIFCLGLAVMPVCLVSSWTFFPISEPSRRSLSVMLTIACIAAAVLYRYFDVRSFFESRENPASSFAVTFPLDELNYEYYILGAFVLALIGSYLFLRDPNNRRQLNIPS
ncbi:MAG TPA: hypothetical protein PKK69_07420 [Ferruginibacter sp.]|nr:hypothetical protein [Ferruginibacter sp.]